jgi:hypothetical protein
MIGITMIKLFHGCEIDAYNAIKNINGVKDVYPLLGEYRLFVVMQAKNMALLYSLVDVIKERPEVASIWNLLISRDDALSCEEFVCSKTNKLTEPDYSSRMLTESGCNRTPAMAEGLIDCVKQL